MMVKAPGWKPAELGGVEPLKPVTPQTFHKYDTEISSGLTNYAFVQFVIVLLSTTAFLLFQGKPTLAENWPLRVFTASLIILSLVNIGAIFEKKKWVLLLEYIRIIAIAGLIIVLTLNTALFTTAAVAAGTFGLLSLLWFTRFYNEISAGKEFSAKTI